jgi:type I restriction enzyme, S subunit
MEVRPGYKQTEVGIIPQDWEVSPLEEFTSFISYGFTNPMPTSESGVYMITAKDINNGKIQFDTARLTTEEAYHNLLTAKSRPKRGDLLLTKDGTLGRLALADDRTICINQSVAILRPNAKAVPLFLKVLLESPTYQSRMLEDAGGSTIKHIYITIVNRMPLAIPPTKAEQEAIAEALSDANAHIESLEQLIAKKRRLKQGSMQELLTGKKRLPGFIIKTGYKQTEAGMIPEDWVVKTLQQTTDCLDNLRVPLNESERLKRPGDIPYCGANGVLDHIDDFVIDGEIILMAEDGGYFDEYLTRPIAYRMRGKCWVNNHVHILKAKGGLDQGFLYYSLVHKNILRFLASGTRAKLNRSELNKIEISLPPTEAEQEGTATILSDMDTDVSALEAKLAKARHIKQGMMQELLTGRIRLV